MRKCLLLRCWSALGAPPTRRFRLSVTVAQLERRVAALEAGRPRIVQVGGGGR